jgi:glycosyltransferase involved in cell wall biosynthesis
LIFLTIAIPTYNRLEYLKELLSKLLKQCEPFPDIEILVSDNCTTDGTFPYIRDVSNLNPQMRYVRNSTNVGGDENFIRCVESAYGNYVWIFGDDEELCEGAISTVMNTLKTIPVSLLIVGIGQESEPHLYGSYADFLKNNKPQTILNHGLITCNVFKKEIFNTMIARNFIKTNFGHMHAIIDSLKKSGTVYITNAPVFTVRMNRAPFDVKPKFIRLKYLQYFLYLGLPYSQIVSFICFDLIWASTLRQIHKVQRIING